MVARIAVGTCVCLLGLVIAATAAPTGGGDGSGSILLPDVAAAGPFHEAVLFGFDDVAFPFRNHVETHLFAARNPKLVVRPGPPGSADEEILYYGTVIHEGGKFRMWYNGNHGPRRALTWAERALCSLCYAESDDGVHWSKPDLGLVEFNGNRHNNIVDFPEPDLWSTADILYDPRDPDPARRYKMAYEAGPAGALRFRVAFSPDGFHWRPWTGNPAGPFLEMSGVTRWNGLYYVTGQASLTSAHRTPVRRLSTFVSADFEHWSPCSAMGLDRGPDVMGPSMEDQLHSFEEIHLGAALWNRGNVLLGIYGQWHGDRSGDRSLLVMDLGLALSHDGLHYREPIPNFRMIPAREQPDGPVGVSPALMQGQGMVNFGDQTLYWYGLWRGNQGSGVRMVTWPRDRLGALEPFAPEQAQTVSCLVRCSGDKPVRVFVNADGLGQRCALHVSLLDEGFRPIAGFSGADAATISANGLRVPVAWKGGTALPPGRTLHLQVDFDGVRPEDARLYAMYLSEKAQ